MLEELAAKLNVQTLPQIDVEINPNTGLIKYTKRIPCVCPNVGQYSRREINCLRERALLRPGKDPARDTVQKRIMNKQFSLGGEQSRTKP